MSSFVGRIVVEAGLMGRFGWKPLVAGGAVALVLAGSVGVASAVGGDGGSVTGGVGNRVWVDANANGVFDSGERGLAGVRVTLSTDAGVARFTGLTAQSGWWGFRGLDVGTCFVLSFEVPGGYTPSPVTDGGNTADASGVVGTPVCVTAGNQDQWDMGLIPDSGTPVTPEAKIGNRVWNDFNANGVQDRDEPGLAGVGIQLQTADGTPLITGQTAEGGWYGFDGLDVGSCYQVVVTAPDGFAPTVSGADSKLGGDGVLGPICPSGDVDDSWDGGLTQATPGAVPKVTINLSLWYDANSDGIRDPNETGARGYGIQASDVTTQNIRATAEPTGPDGITSVSWDFLGFEDGETCNNLFFDALNGNNPGRIFPLIPQITYFDPPLYPRDRPLIEESIENTSMTVCLQGAPDSGFPTLTIPAGQDLTTDFTIGLAGPDPWRNVP